MLKKEENMVKSRATPDTPPRSLMDSTMSPKVKTSEGEGEGVGVCSLVRNTLGVEKRVGALGWD
jgi:hypothetical protein